MINWKRKNGLMVREYDNYAAYVFHQISKLTNNPTVGINSGYCSGLNKRLLPISDVISNKSVLCLGARIGGEVSVFMEYGCFAIGIDLNPGTKNKRVLHGDFHDMIFPDESIDVVFTNAIDHVLYLDKMLGEVKRVLKPSGCFIFEDSLNGEDGKMENPEERACESFYYPNPKMLAGVISQKGFSVFKEYYYTKKEWRPYVGGMVVFRKAV